MKKFFLYVSCFIAVIFLAGCSMDNTPTKKVENFLDSYKNLDQGVLTQLSDMVKTDTLMSDEQRTTYTDILKKQYQDMTYTIKDETIDGDNATVVAEIEVYDYYKVTTDATNYYNEKQDEFKDDTGKVSEAKFIDYRIGKMKEAKDKVKYTINFTLKKVDNSWVLNDIDDATRQKIHGLYAY